jgi:hypothetical protein
MFLLQATSYCSFISLSDFADLAQVIIALANLFLAGYLFFYQFNKDKKIELQTAKLNEQNIKLQWFKELVVQPNLASINQFYINLQGIKGRITSNDLSVAQKEEINNFVKDELSGIRKSFVDVLLQVDKSFSDKILENLDELVDTITNSIFNDELKLAVPQIYEKHIGNKISYSRNNLIALLYNYQGIQG